MPPTKRDELQTFMHGVIQWIFWPTLAAGLFLLAIGEFALGLFGEGFAAGYPVLWLLMLGFLARRHGPDRVFVQHDRQSERDRHRL